jgi:hypothetical protein
MPTLGNILVIAASALPSPALIPRADEERDFKHHGKYQPSSTSRSLGAKANHARETVKVAILRVRTFNIRKGVPFSVAQSVLISRRGRNSDLRQRRMANAPLPHTPAPDAARGGGNRSRNLLPSPRCRRSPRRRTHRSPGVGARVPVHTTRPDTTRPDQTRPVPESGCRLDSVPSHRSTRHQPSPRPAHWERGWG